MKKLKRKGHKHLSIQCMYLGELFMTDGACIRRKYLTVRTVDIDTDGIVRNLPPAGLQKLMASSYYFSKNKDKSCGMKLNIH